MGLRYEAWSLPWLGNFHRKVARLPVLEGTGTLPFLSTSGVGSAVVDTARFDRLDTVISDTEASLISVFDGPDLLHEWFTDRKGLKHRADSQAKFNGFNLISVFDRYILRPYDYGITPGQSIQQDWVWGGETEGGGLLQNGGFETSSLPNGGFEDGTMGYWAPTQADGFLTTASSATFRAVLDGAGADAGSYYGLARALASNSGVVRTISGLTIGETYTITGKLNEPTASGDRFRAGIEGASSASHTNAYESDGYWWAEIDNATQGNGASDGTWQDFTLTFVAAQTSVSLVVLYTDTGAPIDFRLDTWAMSGEGLGLAPWYPHVPSRMEIFERTTTTVRSGTGAARWQGYDELYTGLSGVSGYSHIRLGQWVNVVPGRTYTATAWVRHDAGADRDYRLIIRRRNLIGTGGTFAPGYSWLRNQRQTLTTGTWTQFQFTFVADDVELAFEIAWVYPGSGSLLSPVTFVDDCSLVEGLPATTPGDIQTQLFDSRSDLFDWIDFSSFDETNDSNSDPWIQDVSFTAPWGASFGQILDTWVDLGFEYELVRKATPVGNLTHDFHFYNPAGRDSNPTGTALLPRPGVTGGQAALRIPEYTALMVEGADGSFVEDTDATNLTNFGRLEKFVAHRNIADTATLQLLADQYLAYEEANRNAVQYEIAETPGQKRPGIDYRPGDTIPMSLPPGLTKENRRVQTIRYTYGQPTRYVVTGSRLMEGEAAAFDLVWRLWRRFTRPDEIPAAVAAGGEGGGAAPSVVVAPSDASDLEKARADLICPGTADENVLYAAEDLLAAGGRILLTSGTLSVDVGFFPTKPIHIQGMGSGVTWIIPTFTSGTAISFLTAGDSSISHVGFDGANSFGGECIILGLNSSALFCRGHNLDVGGFLIEGGGDCRVIGNEITAGGGN